MALTSGDGVDPLDPWPIGRDTSIDKVSFVGMQTFLL